jgi:phage internal scaffolding protein
MSLNNSYTKAELKLRNAYSAPLKIKYVNGPGAAEQHHAEATNINNIIKSFQKTGALEHQTKHEARYGEMTGNDFHEAMNIVSSARSMFEELPSKVRNLVDNDPGKFYDYVQNPENKDSLIELGLADESDFPINTPAEPLVTPLQTTSGEQSGTIQQTEPAPETAPEPTP